MLAEALHLTRLVLLLPSGNRPSLKRVRLLREDRLNVVRILAQRGGRARQLNLVLHQLPRRLDSSDLAVLEALQLQLKFLVVAGGHQRRCGGADVEGWNLDLSGARAAGDDIELRVGVLLVVGEVGFGHGFGHRVLRLFVSVCHLGLHPRDVAVHLVVRPVGAPAHVCEPP